MKKLLLTVALTASGIAFAGDRAIKVVVFGTMMAPNGTDLKRVQQTLGQFVANDLIDKYIVQGRGEEGGLQACIEVSSLREQKLQDMVDELKAIHVNENETMYQVKTVANCQ